MTLAHLPGSTATASPIHTAKVIDTGSVQILVSLLFFSPSRSLDALDGLIILGVQKRGDTLALLCMVPCPDTRLVSSVASNS